MVLLIDKPKDLSIDRYSDVFKFKVRYCIIDIASVRALVIIVLWLFLGLFVSSFYGLLFGLVLC